MTTGASASSGRTARAARPLAVLALASVAYRWPALINAGTVNSDAAVVGLGA